MFFCQGTTLIMPRQTIQFNPKDVSPYVPPTQVQVRCTEEERRMSSEPMDLRPLWPIFSLSTDHVISHVY